MRQEKKSPRPLLEDENEFKRVQYSLKMSLRLVNAFFTDMKILQYNQPGIVFDKENERTSAECWLKADD